MDTITQALLGGAVGYAVAGKQSRKKAMLWGAAVAVLPDLDVFIPYDNDLESMTFHRSWTHSWLIQTMLAPLIAALLYRFDKTFTFTTWWLMAWLALVTHSGLDALTVYGTQLFWPFMPSPASGGSVFIIDPTYSLPLLAGFLAILLKPQATASNRIMRFGFAFSCLYLVWGIGAQQWVAQAARQALSEQQLTYKNMQVSATAFNTLLWRVLAVDEDHYYEAYVSLFDDGEKMYFQQHDRGGDLIEKTESLAAFQRINWFTNGLFKLEKQGQTIIASDLRMGMDPAYFFRFRLAEDNGQGIVATIPEQIHTQNNRRDGIRWVWQRIWTPSVHLEWKPGVNSN